MTAHVWTRGLSNGEPILECELCGHVWRCWESQPRKACLDATDTAEQDS